MSEEITHQFPGKAIQAILARFDSIDQSMESFNQQLNHLSNRVTSLEEMVERCLIETRPVWDQVLERLTAVEEEVSEVKHEVGEVKHEVLEVKQRLTLVETRLGKVEREIYHLRKTFRVFNEEILNIQNVHEDLEERVDELEKPRATG